MRLIRCISVFTLLRVLKGDLVSSRGLLQFSFHSTMMDCCNVDDFDVNFVEFDYLTGFKVYY